MNHRLIFSHSGGVIISSGLHIKNCQFSNTNRLVGRGRKKVGEGVVIFRKFCYFLDNCAKHPGNIGKFIIPTGVVCYHIVCYHPSPSVATELEFHQAGLFSKTGPGY